MALDSGRSFSSLVNDVIMPRIGLFLGGVKLTDLKVVMEAAAEIIKAVTWNYGSMFVPVAIDFLIVAFVMFMVIKGINAMKKKEEAAPAAPPPPTKDQVLLLEMQGPSEKIRTCHGISLVS